MIFQKERNRMKKFSSNLSFYLLLLLAASMVTFLACQDDDDEPNKADFIGTYDVSEICNGISYPYTLSIEDVSGSENEVTITNLWDWEEVMNATVDGSTITIPSQLTGEVTFTGTGELTDNTLVITYTAVDDTDTESCVATATQQ